MKVETIIFSGQLHDLSLKAYITETPEEAAKGLSGLKSMGWFDCMVFELDEDKVSIFHTKYMKFPIDIIELNEDQEIIKIHKNVQPGEVSIPVNCKYVIEVKGGFCERFMIEEGDRVFIDDVDHKSAIGRHSMAEMEKVAEFEGIDAESPDLGNTLVYEDSLLKELTEYTNRRKQSIIENLYKSHNEFDIHSDEPEPRSTN
jgi:uncharacterized membrane protein (UPF0127 family)